MFKKQARFCLFVLIIILFSLIIPVSVTAQSIDDLDFVYGTNHYNGATYSSALVPLTVDTFYLLADKTSIVAAKFTQVYYWPITNEYKADWDSANIIVDGSLEIVKGNKVIQTVDLSEYVIQFDGNNKIDTSVLYLDSDAKVARENYETMQAKYRNDLSAYYQLLNEYTAIFQAALAELQRGNITEDQLPQAPPALDDLSLFSTGLLFGFPVNLSVGEYEIRLRLPDESVHPDSQKHLVVFDSLGEGIGYSISGEERWNLPENTSSINEVVYSLKDGTYFIQPVYQKLYNERYYTRMNNPQDTTTRTDRTLWVPFRSAEDVNLSIAGQEGITELNLQPFYVHQILGSKLGYNIIPFDPESMSQPSFTAFKIKLENSLVYSIKLKDKNGEILVGSAREVRIINTNRAWLVYLVSAFPLIIGLGAVFMRRKKIRDIKVVGVG
ncbi:MAG: hypothetical protein ABIG43_00860 [Chloroflexota bacterium]